VALRSNINNWADANNAFRELYNFKDQYTTKNIDFQGRQINNASPATRPNDYVILSQLPTLTTTQQPFNQKRAAGVANLYDKITFGIANGAPAQVGTGFTPPFIWSLPLTGNPLICLFGFNEGPTGSNLVIDLQKGGTSLFVTPITITPAMPPLVAVQKTDFASGLSFVQTDMVTAHILQVGSTFAGQGIEVVVVCQAS